MRDQNLAGSIQLNMHSAQEWPVLKGVIRPPDGLARCPQEKPRPEAAFHPSKQLRCALAARKSDARRENELERIRPGAGRRGRIWR